MSLFNELKRRNVFRVAVAYLAVAWLLTEVASTLFPIFAVPDWGVRFIVFLFAFGFLPTLIFSWVYELTPEGLKREKDVVRDASITQVTAKRLDMITIVLIVAAVTLLLADRFLLSPRFAQQAVVTKEIVTDTVPNSGPESQYPPNSIAVLPFVNMSDDSGNDYFSDGISEELLNLLTTIPDLRVTARTSSFSFKGKDVTIADIGRELNVKYVLEGSVRKAGDLVRVTAQLVETDSETHLWSKAFDRTMGDIFAIQDGIAREVVDSLEFTMLGRFAPKVRETDPEAFVLYLQCRELAGGGNEQTLRRGEDFCRRSMEIAPDYAPSWHSLGRIYHNLAIQGHISFTAGYTQAKKFTLHALELDPNLAVSHASLGWHAMMYERDLLAAATHFQTALRLAPSSYQVLSNASVFAETLGRFDRAIELADQALAVNPLSAIIYGNIAIVHCWAGQFEMARERFDKAFELTPNDQSNLPWRAKCYLLQGMPEKALAEAQRIDLEPRRLWLLGMVYHDLGQHEAADKALNALIEGHADEAGAFIAENYAWRGEPDPAFDWLNRAIVEKHYMWGSLVFDPAFSKLHADPRWAELRAKDGRSVEQVQAIDF